MPKVWFWRRRCLIGGGGGGGGGVGFGGGEVDGWHVRSWTACMGSCTPPPSESGFLFLRVAKKKIITVILSPAESTYDSTSVTETPMRSAMMSISARNEAEPAGKVIRRMSGGPAHSVREGFR